MKFEYAIWALTEKKDENWQALVDHGKQGWELVAIGDLNDPAFPRYFIFKRSEIEIDGGKF